MQASALRQAHTQAGLARALQHIETEDDYVLGNLSETLDTHPMTIRRIDALRRYAGSSEYRRLQALVDRNVVRDEPRD